ncbi:MAG TPA: ferritin family protein [Desulfosalsimonadaceae bacterium]|nr:ferritin family protein [Desulfosalsimonadaceae bacterium]
MAFDFNAKDIFEMAKEIERNGAAFYKSAAEKVEKPDQKNMLLDLAKMEEGHEETFTRMEKDLTSKEQSETIFDPENEAFQYLKALADTRVFFEKEVDTSSMEAILKTALGAEKDSIVFYLGMKELVPEKFGKNRLDGIIKEEMSHVRMLSKELTALR